MSTLQGREQVRFSELLQDTIRVHGLRFAVQYYRKQHGLSALEFRVFAGI